MPVFAQGSRSRLSYATESTFGVNPATGFQELPFVTHSLDLTKDRVQSATIYADGQPRHDRHGNRQIGGDIAVELAAGEYDAFLESALLSTFTSDVLKSGTTPKYFTIEDYAADIDQARVFTGCTVSNTSFSIAPNQMVNTTFTLVGKDMTTSATQVTAAVPAGADPFDAYSGTLELGDAGGLLSGVALITQLDFSIAREFTPTFVLGSASTPALTHGNIAVEGTITAYWEDMDLIDRFIDETETAISVDIDDPSGTNTYNLFMPRVKFNGAAVPVGGVESRMVEIPIVALYDSTEESLLSITRPTP